MCFARSCEDDADDIDIKKGVDISLKIYCDTFSQQQ